MERRGLRGLPLQLPVALARQRGPRRQRSASGPCTTPPGGGRGLPPQTRREPSARSSGGSSSVGFRGSPTSGPPRASGRPSWNGSAAGGNEGSVVRCGSSPALLPGQPSTAPTCVRRLRGNRRPHEQCENQMTRSWTRPSPGPGRSGMLWLHLCARRWRPWTGLAKSSRVDATAATLWILLSILGKVFPAAFVVTVFLCAVSLRHARSDVECLACAASLARLRMWALPCCADAGFGVLRTAGAAAPCTIEIGGPAGGAEKIPGPRYA
mmetsp:Transcript_61667/g.191014  ORF Transcript_61667/g.191014 Transcript_61667/m.191014 type:complete len:267 (-) Transcript_61667:19-819(-)